MRHLTVVVIASVMVISHTSAARADTTTMGEMHQAGGLTTGSMTQSAKQHVRRH